MNERIETLHPEGKQGSNIEKTKYEQVKTAIISALQAHEELTFKELTVETERRMSDDFDGSPGWYTTTVKLDLEARGIIKRVDDKSPQRIRLVAGQSS